MTINNNTNYILQTSGVNNSTSSTLEKIASGLQINKASDDASGLAIVDQLKVQKNTLAQSVENANSGIAMSNIAQSGLSNQKELLENIKTETIKAMNGTTSQEGRDAIADQINKYIDQFDQIADTSTYNDQSLLKTNGDSSDDISIAGEDGFISMEKADTRSVSDDLRTLMSDFSTNPDSMKAMLGLVDESVTKISSQESDFGSSADALESMAQTYLDARTNIANAESEIRDTDIAKMYTEFNKNEVHSQIGYLVQAQANAVQNRTVSLLS